MRLSHRDHSHLDVDILRNKFAPVEQHGRLHVEPWHSAKEAFAIAADPTVSSKVLLRFGQERES